ncbi:MAG: hypothetical protein WD358_00470 [Nitriliruptoraceae bacterium]
MDLDHDDAKTDIVLAGAAAIFGGTIRGFVSQVPGYPRSGMAAVIVEVAWLIAVTALVPLMLARYRGDRWAAFGLTQPVRGITVGIVVAAPIVAGGIVLGLAGSVAGAAAPAWWWGRLGGAVAVGNDLVTRIAVVTQFVTLVVGVTLLIAFLATRGASLQRSPQWAPVRMIRTIGLPAVGAALVTGVIRVIVGWPLLPVIVQVAAVAGVLTLVDRRVRIASPMPRSTVIAPVIIVGVLHLFAAGGLFRGDLLAAVHGGGLAIGVTVATVLLARTRATAWAIVPLFVAVHFWPLCLSPLAIRVPGVC